MQTTPATDDSLDTIALAELPPVTGGVAYACPRPPVHVAPPRPPVHSVAPTPCFPPYRFGDFRFNPYGFRSPYDRGFPGFGFYR
jgi:hypothetical protein